MKTPKKAPSNNNRRLVRHVGFALICKIAFIAGLGFLFFGSSDRITTNADVVGNALLAPSSQSTAPAKNSE